MFRSMICHSQALSNYKKKTDTQEGSVYRICRHVAPLDV